MRRIHGTILMLAAAAGLAVHIAAAQSAGPQARDMAKATQPDAAGPGRAEAALPDMRKYVVESPLKAVLAGTGEAPAADREAAAGEVEAVPVRPAPAPGGGGNGRVGVPRRDRGKSAVEFPVKAVLASTREGDATVEGTAAATVVPSNSAVFENAAEPQNTIPARSVPRLDIGKTLVESPLKSVLASTRDAEPAVESTPVPARPRARPAPPAERETSAVSNSAVPRNSTAVADNPAVAPGDVRWHEGLDAARAAAGSSGKPVLLFQMIGRLDQRFT